MQVREGLRVGESRSYNLLEPGLLLSEHLTRVSLSFDALMYTRTHAYTHTRRADIFRVNVSFFRGGP